MYHTNSRLFRCRIGLISFVGYATGVCGVSVIDPILTSHVLFGSRHYPYAWVWWLLSPLTFIAPYVLLRRYRAKHSTAIISVAPLAILGVIASFFFPPERPHAGILFSALGFALIAFLTAWLSFSPGDYRFLVDCTIPFPCRLERVKASVSWWQSIAVYSTMGYMAFAISWAYVLLVSVPQIVDKPADRFFLQKALILEVFITSFCVLLGPLWELFSIATVALSQITKIKGAGGMEAEPSVLTERGPGL
jgi:hypothetical protein